MGTREKYQVPHLELQWHGNLRHGIWWITLKQISTGRMHKFFPTASFWNAVTKHIKKLLTCKCLVEDAAAYESPPGVLTSTYAHNISHNLLCCVLTWKSNIYATNSCTLQTYKTRTPKLRKLMFHLEYQIYKILTFSNGNEILLHQTLELPPMPKKSE